MKDNLQSGKKSVTGWEDVSTLLNFYWDYSLFYYFWTSETASKSI